MKTLLILLALITPALAQQQKPTADQYSDQVLSGQIMQMSRQIGQLAKALDDANAKITELTAKCGDACKEKQSAK